MNPCIEVNCGEAHIWNGVGWKPTKWWHGELMLPFPIQSWRWTHHSDDGKIWTPLKLPWRISRWVPICSSDCLAAPRQDLWWLWRDGAQHLCWGCPTKRVKICYEAKGSICSLADEAWHDIYIYHIYTHTYVFWNSIQKIYTYKLMHMTCTYMICTYKNIYIHMANIYTWLLYI